MAGDDTFLNEVLGNLTTIGDITSKPMFGGYGIFHDGAMFGIVKGNGLFLKVGDSNRPDYEKAASVQYKPMPYFRVPANVISKAPNLLEWALASIKVAHEPPPKKEKKK